MHQILSAWLGLFGWIYLMAVINDVVWIKITTRIHYNIIKQYYLTVLFNNNMCTLQKVTRNRKLNSLMGKQKPDLNTRLDTKEKKIILSYSRFMCVWRSWYLFTIKYFFFNLFFLFRYHDSPKYYQHILCHFTNTIKV